MEIFCDVFVLFAEFAIVVFGSPHSACIKSIFSGVSHFTASIATHIKLRNMKWNI